MPTKTCAVQVKTATAADDSTLQEGQFTALASVFNNVDAVGDVVMPGAFADDLKAWQESGDPIPLLWGHQMQDPDMNLGHVLEASETDAGLLIKAQLDIADNPKAMRVYRLLKGKRVRKMSFAYDIEDAAPAERGGEQVYELRKLKLHEVSVVQVPANPLATIQEVKAAADRRRAATAADSENAAGAAGPAAGPAETDAPASKATTENHTALLAALDRITGVLTDVKAVLDSLKTSNDGTANPTQPATAEEPPGAKTDSPASRPGPASLRLRTDLDQLSAEVISLTD